MITVEVKTYGKRRELFERRLRLEMPKVVASEAQRGAMYARSIAPVRTGALMQAIGASMSGNNSSWVVVSRNPAQSRGRPRPYHVMMHDRAPGFPNISHRIRTGEPKYMDKTYENLRKGFPEKIRTMVRKTITGKSIPV